MIFVVTILIVIIGGIVLVQYNKEPIIFIANLIKFNQTITPILILIALILIIYLLAKLVDKTK